MESLIDSGNSNPALDPNKDYYTDLVGEGKKFKDNAALAYSKMHADMTIQMKDRLMDDMRRDLEEARAEAASRKRVEEFFDRLNNPGTTQPPVTTETKPEIDQRQTSLDMTQIESLVSRKIQETEVQKKQRENLDMVKTELTKRFGDNLEHHLKSVGLDGESAAQLAKTNPQLVLKALGADKPVDNAFQSPPRNTFTSPNSPVTPQRTWSYYQDMFKKNPNLKYDPKVNTQMQKDYASIGKAFEDGDFNRFGDSSF